MEKITRLNRTDTDKEGNALVSKQGKPYSRLSLKVESQGDKWVSGFGNAQNKDWKVGDEVDIIITPKDEYLNFSMPKKDAVNNDLLKEIFDNTETILNKLTGFKIDMETIKAAVNPKKPVYPTRAGEGLDESVPFDDRSDGEFLQDPF